MKPLVIPRTRKVSNNEKRQSIDANPEMTGYNYLTQILKPPL